jgi:hypothetical protein
MTFYTNESSSVIHKKKAKLFRPIDSDGSRIDSPPAPTGGPDVIELSRYVFETPDEIGATERTVKFHRGHIMRKMQVKSLAELSAWPRRLESEAKGYKPTCTKGQ